MKKLLFSFVFIGILIVATPKSLFSECYIYTLPCGPAVMCCYPGDEVAWYQIYCEQDMDP